MKNALLLLILLIIIGLTPPSVMAQTAAPKAATSSATTSPLNEDEMKNVKKIIDLVASNSASQKNSEKRGVLGKVLSASSTTLTLEALSHENRTIDIDDITKFSDAAVKTFGVSDIKTGDMLGVIGVFNKVSEHILARNITRISTVPTYFEGVILSTDKVNFTLEAIDEKGFKKLINIETSTKITSFTKDDGQVKSGFSKIKAGQRLYVAGFPDLKVKDQINADRIIFFPDLAISQGMKNYFDLENQNTSTPSAKPTQ